MLEIIVCIKAVPDPKDADKVKIDPETKTLLRGDVSLTLNQFDKNAVEAALKIKAQMEARITVVSMGPPETGKILKECLALGCDRGYLLSDRAFAGADAQATAFTLAKGIEKIGHFDVILCGMASSDGATEWVGPELAVFLDVPVVTLVEELEAQSEGPWTVKSGLENGYRILNVTLPAVFTVTMDLNTPRTLSFSGIIKARKKEITQWNLEDLGVTKEQVGLTGSPTIVSDFVVKENKRSVEMITGSREEKAEFLVKKLAAAGVL